jgi:hypothetical protein
MRRISSYPRVEGGSACGSSILFRIVECAWRYLLSPPQRGIVRFFVSESPMPAPIPTERKVLRFIYDMNESKYLEEVKKSNIGQVMVPIDLDAVSSKLGCSKYLLFGYLYYHLDHKHRYKSGENASVHLFAPRAGALQNAVNFPYLAAILAGHDQEHSKFAWSLGVSLVALALSVGAIVAQLVSAK